MEHGWGRYGPTTMEEMPALEKNAQKMHRRPQAVLAWIIIALLTGGTAAATLFWDVPDNGIKALDDAIETDETAESASSADEPQFDTMVTVQGRVLLGQLALTPSPEVTEPLLSSDQPKQRIRGAIMAALHDKPVAEEHLGTVASNEAFTPAMQALARTTAAVLNGKGSTDDRSTLEHELGYFGTVGWAIGMDASLLEELKASALRMIFILVGGLIVVGIAGVTGLVLCILALVRIGQGSMRSGLGSADAMHGLYAETFAVWLAFFNLLSIAAALLAEALDISVFIPILFAFPVSLLVLGWPSLRGSTFARTRADIGLTSGVGVLREMGAGVVGWMCMLPIQGIGILITMGLMALAGVQDGDADAPTHPIVDAFGDNTALISSLLLAVVMAPLIEETVFRGLLYRQLRSVGRLGRGVVSCLASALITGFVFAAIHPQGWMAIPALMGLAIGMALAREWRGCLIAPMVMHGINNGLALTALMVILFA